MPSSQADWNAKHKLAAEALPSEPASIVRELLSLLPAGPALDIACGTGRHALLLAERGQHVTAIDFSTVALDILEARARDTRVPVRRSKSIHEAVRSFRGGLELMQADLGRIQFPAPSHGLILCLQFFPASPLRQMAPPPPPHPLLL